MSRSGKEKKANEERVGFEPGRWSRAMADDSPLMSWMRTDEAFPEQTPPLQEAAARATPPAGLPSPPVTADNKENRGFGPSLADLLKPERHVATVPATASRPSLFWSLINRTSRVTQPCACSPRRRARRRTPPLTTVGHPCVPVRTNPQSRGAATFPTL